MLHVTAAPSDCQLMDTVQNRTHKLPEAKGWQPEHFTVLQTDVVTTNNYQKKRRGSKTNHSCPPWNIFPSKSPLSYHLKFELLGRKKGQDISLSFSSKKAELPFRIYWGVTNDRLECCPWGHFFKTWYSSLHGGRVGSYQILLLFPQARVRKNTETGFW